jgi:hypothetical protein
MAPINADAILDCRTGDTGLACAGGDKPHTVYGALTWLALADRCHCRHQGTLRTLVRGRTQLLGLAMRHEDQRRIWGLERRSREDLSSITKRLLRPRLVIGVAHCLSQCLRSSRTAILLSVTLGAGFLQRILPVRLDG